MISPSQFWLYGWPVCLNFAMDFADYFVVDDPFRFWYFIERGFAVNIFRFGSHSWFLGFKEFSVLEFFWNFYNHVSGSCRGLAQICHACCIYFLVYGFGLNFSCLLIFFLDSDRICRAYFHFCFILFWILCLFISLGPRSIYFLVLFCLFRFVGTWLLFRGPWCQMFVLFQFKSCILMWSWT